MSHDIMEKCMIIASNDKNWTKEENDMLIHRAVCMQKRRRAGFTSKNTSTKNVVTINVQTSGELAQCSAMEENSSSDKSNSELDIGSESSSSDSEEKQWLNGITFTTLSTIYCVFSY